MNKIFNMVLLTLEKFMPEFHLRQPVFTDSTCGLFTKHCERIQNFRESGNLKDIHGNELDEPCFAHYAAYSNSKNVSRRTVSDKVLKKLMKLLEILNMMEIEEDYQI